MFRALLLLQEIPTSPFRVKVDPSHDASKVKAEGPGLNKTGESWVEMVWTVRGCCRVAIPWLSIAGMHQWSPEYSGNRGCLMFGNNPVPLAFCLTGL